MSRRTSKRHSPQEKITILKRHLLDHAPISEVCDDAGIHPTQFWRRQKQLFENGALALESKRPKADPNAKRVESLEKKIQNKNEVLAELMEAHVALEKELGEL
jgi:transposase-like protein